MGLYRLRLIVELINPFQTQENRMIDSTMTRRDEAMRKGAIRKTTASDGMRPRQHSSFTDQLGHRDQDEMLKENDTDFPEPDAKAEHTGR